MARTIKTTQTRSAIGRLPKHKTVLLGLGLCRIGHTVEREDTPAIRGMIDVISFMVKVEEQGIRLNALSPAEGSEKTGKRLSRGIDSGLGKTGGRDYKGQKSRSGGDVCRGFKGGQIPLYRCLPEFGLTSRKAAITAEVRPSGLAKVEGGVVDLNTLKAANIIGVRVEFAKVVLVGEITTPVTVRGLRVTKGARTTVEAANGETEEQVADS